MNIRTSEKNSNRHPRVIVILRILKNGSVRALRIILIPCHRRNIMAIIVITSAVWIPV